MNLVKIAAAAFSATNIMTSFSYIISACFKKLFREPVIMDFILRRLGIKLKGRWNKAAGWFAHYLIGFIMVLFYTLLWRYTDIDFGFISGIVFGMASGLIGIAIWRKIYLTIHRDVSSRYYYIELFAAHIILRPRPLSLLKYLNMTPFQKFSHTFKNIFASL